MGKPRRRQLNNGPQFTQKVLNIVKSCSLEKSDAAYHEAFNRYHPKKHQIKVCIAKLFEELRISQSHTVINVGMFTFVKLYAKLNDYSERKEFNKKLFALFVSKVDKEYFDDELYQWFRPFFHSLDRAEAGVLAAMLPDMLCSNVSTQVCTIVLNLVCRHRQFASKILSKHPKSAILKEKCMFRETERRKLYLDYHSRFPKSTSECGDDVLYRIRLRALTNDNEFFTCKYLMNKMPEETCAFITLCRTGLQPVMRFRQLKRMEVDNEIILKKLASFIVNEYHKSLLVQLYASKWIEFLLFAAIDSPSLMDYLQELELYEYTFTDKRSSSNSEGGSYFDFDESDDFDFMNSDQSYYSDDSDMCHYMHQNYVDCQPYFLSSFDDDLESSLDIFDEDDDEDDEDGFDVFAHEDEGVADYDFESNWIMSYFDDTDERNFVRHLRNVDRHLLFYYRIPN